jgi:hypothetical protein
LFYKGYTWLNAATKRKKKLSVIRLTPGSFARKRTQVASADDGLMVAVVTMLRAIKRAQLGLVKALPTLKNAGFESDVVELETVLSAYRSA